MYRSVPERDTKPLLVSSRTAQRHGACFKLSDGSHFESRRFLLLGKGDAVLVDNDEVWVLARRDNAWINITSPWSKTFRVQIAGQQATVTIKEIDSSHETCEFSTLQTLHYRGAGGAGRTAPLVAESDIWDFPTMLGFIEISSSMIANSARTRFLDYPYNEPRGIHWKSWNRAAAREYSAIICRISRFVIHPELRGLGLARIFTAAATEYAADRWHFGGFRPRFLEITADMLRYYAFLDEQFAFVGNTEGNEHRLKKDMTYLVRKALRANDSKGMPQGGGGIMTLQRGYAKRLLEYTRRSKRTFPEIIDSLSQDVSSLDQAAWEALHTLNRRPKPCFVAGLTPYSRDFTAARSATLSVASPPRRSPTSRPAFEFSFVDVCIRVSADISQTKDARILQDAFGFVGSNFNTSILQPTSLLLRPGTVSLVCGASGSGKSLFLQSLVHLSSGQDVTVAHKAQTSSRVDFSGKMVPHATVATLPALPPGVTPLALAPKTPLTEFLAVTAQVGLAEPQLFVRPTETLSSGQKYRLQVALGILRQPDIIVVDNFCENLDRFTISAVCKGLRRLAVSYGVAVLVATAAYERMQGPLKAHQVLLLRRGARGAILNEYAGTDR